METRIRKQSQAGFTLVEIIIVFSLIALISTYMMGTSFLGSRARARDSKRKTDLASLTKIMAMKIFLDTEPDFKQTVAYKVQDEKYNSSFYVAGVWMRM